MKVASETVGAIAERRSNSLAVIVQREVERMIMSGDLAAGERINEQHLATRLGVSRGPVREALRALERTGLVHVLANQGTFVRKVGIEEVAEMYDMRAVIFGFAAARLAEQASSAQKAALQAAFDEMEAVIAAGDPPAYYQLNLRFHDLVMEFSGHGRADQLYRALVREGHLFRQRALLPEASMRESNAEHAEIVAAIVAGDAAWARQIAEEHHNGGKRRWLATLTRRDRESSTPGPAAARHRPGEVKTHR